MERYTFKTKIQEKKNLIKNTFSEKKKYKGQKRFDNIPFSKLVPIFQTKNRKLNPLCMYGILAHV
jgi:hypothetical protein